MKVVICWSHISGYMASCWRALSARGDVDYALLAFQSSNTGTIAFDDALVAGLPCRLLSESEHTDANLVRSLVLREKPDVVVIPGWFHDPYVRLTRDPELAHARFCMTVDTPRRDTLRQRLGRFKIAPLRQRLSRVIVAGERAWQLARMLGFAEEKIRKGMYGVDYDALAPLYERRASQPGGWPRRFLFTGRYVDDKGIDVLLDAYRRYRALRREAGVEPWPLTCCGTGPLSKLLHGQAGVTDRGFMQPSDAHGIMAGHGVFVLASRYDPWPLVLVEATASGMPVVHTETCGSAVECVRNYYNGRSVATGNAEALTEALKWCEDHHAELPEMGRRAQPLAEPHSARAWAHRWKAIFDELAHEKTSSGA
jgi:glycosyltransferase involved in cell wall biosynthesis